jgi:hypothetical protein
MLEMEGENAKLLEKAEGFPVHATIVSSCNLESSAELKLMYP